MEFCFAKFWNRVKQKNPFFSFSITNFIIIHTRSQTLSHYEFTQVFFKWAIPGIHFLFFCPRPRNYSSCFCLRPKAKDLGITCVVVLGFFFWSMLYQLPPPCYPFIFFSLTPPSPTIIYLPTYTYLPPSSNSFHP